MMMVVEIVMTMTMMMMMVMISEEKSSFGCLVFVAASGCLAQAHQ
jgi:hypothetical protein